MFLLKRTQLPNLWYLLGISQIHYRIPMSDTNLYGQMGSMSGSYFGRFGFKTRQTDYHSSTEYVSEAALYSIVLCSSNKPETAVFNRRLNVCCSYRLLACDIAY